MAGIRTASKQERIAIVSSGGGMRCSYAAGVFVALAKEYSFTAPSLVVAASGSAGAAAYYLSGQYDAIRTIWTELLSTPRFVSLARFWRILDVDYLVDEVLAKQQRLDTVRFYANTTRHFIPVRDVRTKSVSYITNTDDVDIFETLRAAKALPIFYGGKVHINGRRYSDGAFGTTFEQTIADAKTFGATRTIAIDVRARAKRRRLRQSLCDDSVVLISNDDLPAGLITRSKKALTESFELGYCDAVGDTALRRLLTQDSS